MSHYWHVCKSQSDCHPCGDGAAKTATCKASKLPALVQHEEHAEHRKDRQQPDEPGRVLLTLELALQGNEVADGKLHGVDARPHVLDHAAQVAAGGVGQDHDAAADVVVVDDVGPGRFDHLGQARQRGAQYRPAHVHVKVQVAGYKLLTTQLYFEGDPYNDIDPFIKKGLIMKVADVAGARRRRSSTSC